MNESTALETILEYYRVFSALELNAIVAFYSEPCMVVGPQGVFGAAGATELAIAFSSLIEGLKARGYGRSEFTGPEVAMLCDTAALVRGVAVRYRTDGSELERVPISYILHRSEEDWKIAVMVLASPES